MRLASANPKDAPICDPALLTHPFDKVTAINSVKAALRVPGSPAASGDIDVPMNTPPTADDDELWFYIEQNAFSVWHMVCASDHV